MAQEAQSGLTKLFGDALQGKEGDVATSSLAGNDAIGVYFSAHWCPPCRGFTPKLVETYNKMKAAGKKFEIIFVSSDRDQKSFDEYYNEMPWLALKFDDRKRKAKLSKKFGVNGIPSFQIISTDGKILTNEGRGAVGEDPEGAKFPAAPWQKPPKKPFFESIEGTKFAGKDGKEVTIEEVRKNKYLMLYFSAHWCPPCRGFTPKFAEWYNNNKAKMDGTDKSFDVVFVSSDRDQKSFDDYFGEQPWLALPYSARDLKSQISENFEVQGIPTLVVIDCATGKTVSDAGRAGVTSDPNCEKFPWPKESCEFLNGSNVAPINDTPMLTIFAGGATAEQQNACLAAVKPKAEVLFAKSKAEDEGMEVEFRVDKGDSGFTDRLKGLGVADGQIAVIFDISEKKLYNAEDIKSVADVTADRITKFVDDFLAEKLTGTALKM